MEEDKTVKIIVTDNFDRDWVDDILVAKDVPFIYAKTIVDALNAEFGGRSGKYFIVKENNSKLRKFEP